ncbi:MAG TPA: hypothetical protein VI009_16440 [Xanthobacteraceae bacterium]|jgi:hypothetical protein
MPKIPARRSAIERETRQGSAGQRPIALVELIITAALVLSTAVAVTAVSIGIARAEVVGAVSQGEGISIALGLLLIAVGGLTAMAAGGLRRH